MKTDFDLLRALLLQTLDIDYHVPVEYNTNEQLAYHVGLLRDGGYISSGKLTPLGREAANLMRDGTLWCATIQHVASSYFEFVPLSVIIEMLRQEMIEILRG